MFKNPGYAFAIVMILLILVVRIPESEISTVLNRLLSIGVFSNGEAPCQ